MNNQPDEKDRLAIYEAAQRRKAGLAIYEAAQLRKDRQKPQQGNSYIYGQPPAPTTAPQPAHDAVETNQRKIPPLLSAIADFIARLIAVLLVTGIVAILYALGYSIYYGERSRAFEPVRTVGITIRNAYENLTGGETIKPGRTLSKQERQANPHMLLLNLTNEARAKAGVPPVQMGTNPAAQLHAEAALDGCYSGHWDRWGLKPYHRYSLTGGDGHTGENVSGLDYCIQPQDNYLRLKPLQEEVNDAIKSWLESPGHRRTMLDPHFTVLNTGMAHDEYNIVLVQLFDTDYVQYTTRPWLNAEGKLKMAGKVHGASLDIGDTTLVQIYYDPPPVPLDRGQLAQTYALCNPTHVGFITEPLPLGWSYDTTEIRQDIQTHQCADPYHIPAGRVGPASPDEAHEAWVQAKQASHSPTRTKVETRRIIARTLKTKEGNFDLNADLSPILNRHGPGIYTVLLWGKPFHTTTTEPISEQSIFWQTEVPEGSPYRK